MEDRYTYQVGLTWTGEKKADVTAEGMPTLTIATPPEFDGHPGIWSPEQLLITSVGSCIMNTFIAIAAASKFEFASYKSTINGTLERVERVHQFTRVEVSVELGVSVEDQIAKGERLLQKAEEKCFVSNSLKSDVHLNARVSVV